MSFEFPWMLLGMLAGAIPVVIHLINRQRAKLRPFAAISFLLLSDKRLARRLKLKQLIVLVLRVLLLAAIPFALAKPYVEPESVAALEPSAPGAIALVIDDSMSMQAKDSGGSSLLDDAIDRARAIASKGGFRTSFAVIAAGEPARLLTPGLTFERDSVDRALARLGGRARATDMAGALREAERVLAQSGERRRRVVIIGDQAAHAWEGLSEPWALRSTPGVELIDVREGAEVENRAVLGVEVRPAPELGENYLEVETSVANYGTTREDVPLTINVGGKVVGGVVSPRPGEVERKKLDLQLDAASEMVTGTATIGPDALDRDDSWYFVVDFGGTIDVAVVNGSPSAVPHEDELFFLRPALAPRGAGSSRIHPIYLLPSNLTAQTLENVEVAILANVGELSSTQAVALAEFVERGGGLLVTAGDQLGEQTSRSIEPLLPFPIRAIKRVADPSDPASALKALNIANADFEHPVMAIFQTVEDASLFRSKVYAYALVDAAMRPGTRALASYTGGIPAIVEGRLGQGRVIMLTTSIDRDWSDLAIRSSFLPLVQQLVAYLAGRLERELSSNVLVGAIARASVPPGSGPLVLERPDGSRVDLSESEDASTTTVQIPDTDLVGHYALQRQGSRATGTLFAVNGPRTESDLHVADMAELREILARPGKGIGIEPDPALSAEEPAERAPNERRTRVWPVVLVGLFVLLASEAWLVIRG